MSRIRSLFQVSRIRDTFRISNLRGALGEFLQEGDVLLLALCLIASGFGLVLIYSATRYSPKMANLPLKQAASVVLGVICYIFFTFVDIEVLMEKWKWGALFSVLFILALRTPLGVAGESGNLNWLDIPGIPFNIQPAEIVKLFFVLLLTKQMVWLRNSGQGLGSFSSVAQLAGTLLAACGLIFVVSGDAGMVVIYALIFVVMIWTGGVNKRWLIFAFLLFAAAAAAAVIFLPETRYWSDYRIMRFRVLFDHSLDVLGIGWHQTRSLLAIGSGQLTGQGFLHGTQTQSALSSALPGRQTDFIFSVCGEEFGLIGCIGLLLTLVAIIVRCFYDGLCARSSFLGLVAVGFFGMLCSQVILNIGMCLYLAPVIGITLPFYSYGGSSVLTMYAAMGIVSGIRMRSLPSWLRDRGNL